MNDVVGEEVRGCQDGDAEEVRNLNVGPCDISLVRYVCLLLFLLQSAGHPSKWLAGSWTAVGFDRMQQGKIDCCMARDT